MIFTKLSTEIKPFLYVFKVCSNGIVLNSVGLSVTQTYTIDSPTELRTAKTFLALR
ncbi:hypothetical protein [cyanobacterium endosymbiont of Rhopalodia gibberula]|uniref:hypothetical protein n=1 Tax=cyanobacterium endosymbiont of Rhopalodia gibberula TaxID=1763363 RepID=UPI0015597591|nr:hypothetical protein [cyanobacterium endosymbiont of Rhopalodia gibberula]